MTTTTTSSATLFENRTLQKAFIQDAIKVCLRFRKNAIRLGNVKDARAFMAEVHDYLIKHDSCGLYTTYENIWNALERYGVTTGMELITLMDNKREELTGLGYDMSKIKTIKSDEFKKSGYKSFGRRSSIGMDDTRTIVIRSKYGNYPPMFYDYEGPVRNCPEMTKIKLDYHWATGCKYYEVRPILKMNWDALPEDKKNCTVVCDSSDIEEA